MRTARFNPAGPGGASLMSRVHVTCVDLKNGGENFVSKVGDVKQAVVQMLIDAASFDRIHRRNLLGKNWTFVSCYKIGNVGTTAECWVQIFGE
jgi:hypothetical protein